MIRIENVEVHGFESAVRGMRNPMNSWDKSDSNFSCRTCDGCYYANQINEDGESRWCNRNALRIGENDLNLMRKLISAGTDHSKFMRYIVVSFDTTAPPILVERIRNVSRRGR